MAGYGDDSGFNAWLAENGYSLPDGALAEAVLRNRGSVYVDGAYGVRFPGTPTGGTAQERAWPRTDAQDFYGNDIDPNTVPTRVIEASYAAAWYEANNDGALSVAVSTNTRVKREKVEGAVEVEYAVADGDLVKNALPVLTTIEGLLRPLLLSAQDTPGVLIV